MTRVNVLQTFSHLHDGAFNADIISPNGTFDARNHTALRIVARVYVRRIVTRSEVYLIILNTFDRSSGASRKKIFANKT